MAVRQDRIERVVSLAKSYGVTRLILFGSALDRPEYARDVDLACDGLSEWKLFEFGARIEDELGMPLDIVSLSPPNRFTRYIENKGKALI